MFARTSPKHKLEIVKRAQALGHIVGVTGVRIFVFASFFFLFV